MHDRDLLPLPGVDDSSSARSSTSRDATPFHLAARASYITPILAVVLGMLTTAARGRNLSVTTAMVIGIMNLLILTIGILLAIIALGGMKRHGRPGLLWPATAGLVINLAFIGLIAASYFHYRRTH
jgi:hypothetical protein